MSTYTTQQGFSVETFARFWADPDPALVPAAVTTDVVGYWPGAAEPARGPAEYTRRIAEVLDLLPDLHLEVAEHAENGPFVFVRWIARATGRDGEIEFSGIDRIRLRDGLVAENVIVFDTGRLTELVGRPLPWM